MQVSHEPHYTRESQRDSWPLSQLPSFPGPLGRTPRLGPAWPMALTAAGTGSGRIQASQVEGQYCDPCVELGGVHTAVLHLPGARNLQGAGSAPGKVCLLFPGSHWRLQPFSLLGFLLPTRDAWWCPSQDTVLYSATPATATQKDGIIKALSHPTLGQTTHSLLSHQVQASYCLSQLGNAFLLLPA